MPEDVATPPPTAVAPSGPAALNAVSDETLRHHVAAVLSQPLKEQLAIAPARIAPFMTNGMLVRVREAVVNITNTEDWSGWGLVASLGRVLAALTGAPMPADFATAQHIGNAAGSRVTHSTARVKNLRKRSKRSKAALKAEVEKLYVCNFRGTPDHPDEAVLRAAITPQSAPPPPPTSTTPVPVQPRPRLMNVPDGFVVKREETWQQLQGQAASARAAATAAATAESKHAAEADGRAAAEAAQVKAETKGEANAVRAEAAEKRQSAEAKAHEAREQFLGTKVASSLRELAAAKRRAEVAEREVKRQKTAVSKERTEADLARLKPEVQLQVRAVLQAQLDRNARLKSAALKRARQAEGRAALATKRLKGKQEAEARAEGLEVEKDELAEELAALRAANAKLAARQGPDLGGGREQGRFAAAAWQMRALCWGQLARRTPPTAVGPNVVDAARLLAPGAPVREPHPEQVRKMRVEMGVWLGRPSRHTSSPAASASCALASTRPPSCRPGCSAPTSSARWRRARSST